MDQAVLKYFTQGLAPSTRATYSSAIRRFLQFCHTYNLTRLPLTEPLVSRYAAYLAEGNLTSTTIRLYLAALRYLQIAKGLPDPNLMSNPYLQLVLRGIQRSSTGQPRPKRLPITPLILQQLHSLWSTQPIAYDKVMLWATCCLGFFGFMRSGEFTCPSLAAFETSMLTPADVVVDSRLNPTYLSIHLRRSKTDQFGTGTTIVLGRTNTHVCPVAALLSYMSIRSHTGGPLFLFQDGRTLSKSRLVACQKESLNTLGINPDGYSGHSFRIGAATAAAAAGLSDSLIQSLGRWKSSAFLEYLRILQSTLTQISPLLLHHNI